MAYAVKHGVHMIFLLKLDFFVSSQVSATFRLVVEKGSFNKFDYSYNYVEIQYPNTQSRTYQVHWNYCANQFHIFL